MRLRFTKITVDIIIVTLVTLLSYFMFSLFDVMEKIVEISSKYEQYEIDEIISTFIVLAFLMVWFSFRRWKDSISLGFVIKKKNEELQKALDEVRQLKGILPICSYCKKIRCDSGYWEQVDIYLQKHSEADISHGICPECLEKHYPEEFKKIQHNKSTKYREK